MRSFTNPIISLPVPSRGAIAAAVGNFVKGRLIEAVPAFAEDPVAEVSSTPASDYTEVMIFLGREELIEEVEAQIPEMKAELKNAGIWAAFYVRKAA